MLKQHAQNRLTAEVGLALLLRQAMRHVSNAKARQELPSLPFPPTFCSLIDVNEHCIQDAWTCSPSATEAGSDRYNKYSP
jgi:hypothetical protein